MIDLYSWATPNGHKVHIMLEECRLPYAIHPIDISKGAQFDPDFLKISPNNKMPAIVDSDGPDGKPISLFESGAILIYLAAKAGKLMPKSERGKYQVLQWLMWQMAGFGPMIGQAHHFRNYAPQRIDYGIERYTNEAHRLYGVLDKQLEKTGAHVVGNQYTIADIAIFPWVRVHENHGVDLTQFPQVARWFDKVSSRPAVQRGVKVLADLRKPGFDAQARELLFGASQYKRR